MQAGRERRKEGGSWSWQCCKQVCVCGVVLRRSGAREVKSGLVLLDVRVCVCGMAHAERFFSRQGSKAVLCTAAAALTHRQFV